MLLASSQKVSAFPPDVSSFVFGRSAARESGSSTAASTWQRWIATQKHPSTADGKRSYMTLYIL